MKFRIGFPLFSEEIQKIPLRHERDEFAVGGKMRKVGDRDGKVFNERANFTELLMRALEEFVEKAELVHEFQGGGMNGVAAKIAEKIGVLFEDEDFDTSAGEKKTQNHACGAPANDTASGLEG